MSDSNYKVLTLNDISVSGLERLPRDRYEVASEIAHPHAVLVRSADMHDMDLPDSLLAVARAGAGVNNIPVATLSKRGIPVFNAPGANANAVKELVLASLFLAARNLFEAVSFVRDLEVDGAALERAVEGGKKQFKGFELPGRTLGVVGLGAIGVEVANAAQTLGMRVLGFDPKITVERAWQLSSSVEQAASLEDLLARSDVVTVHVPLVEGTRSLFNQDRIARMKQGAVLLNFARGPIVDEAALLAGLASGRISRYLCDFPTDALARHQRVIALPHLGASTLEAEENCAMMAVDSLRGFLEHGEVRHSVNYPDTTMPRSEGSRLVICNANIPNMLGQISTVLADAKLNIIDMLNRSKGEVAFTLVDVEGPVADGVTGLLGAIDGVLSVRRIR
jgi:D-3-phosphoglycerate dehydrogenase / 2-oxoglutarate reductase